MTYRTTKLITAMLVMAVIFIALVSGGCATKRDIAEINDRLSNLESQGSESRRLVANMDSLVTAATESNRQLQNDVRQSNDELANLMAQLLENYNDLMARLDQMSQQPIYLPLQGSPGATATGGGSGAGPAEEPPRSRQPEVDCIDTYDNAFTLVRRGEYVEAIDGFRTFLADCQSHADAGNAYYWVGECFYSQEKYSEAVAEYEHLLSAYANSPNEGRTLYKLARCKQELGADKEARKLFERLVADHAGTLEADQATERLKDL